MREEITEPQHWRTSSQRNANHNASWSSRRRSQNQAGLAAEAVDAALAQESDRGDAPSSGDLVSSEIISNLASQLDLLEKQREQLQQLLDHAQASQ